MSRKMEIERSAETLNAIYKNKASTAYWQRKLDRGELFFVAGNACVRVSPSKTLSYKGEVHLFGRVRKQEVADLCDEVIRWLRENTECETVHGKVPVDKPAFLALYNLAQAPKTFDKKGNFVVTKWRVRHGRGKV